MEASAVRNVLSEALDKVKLPPDALKNANPIITMMVKGDPIGFIRNLIVSLPDNTIPFIVDIAKAISEAVGEK